MENTNSKILTMSFALAGALCGITVHLLIKILSGAFGVIARMTDTDLVRHGLPVATGLIVFAALQFNPRVLAWAEEVVAEVRKVTFPSGRETSAMTVVVVIFVLVASAIITTTVPSNSSGEAMPQMRQPISQIAAAPVQAKNP